MSETTIEYVLLQANHKGEFFQRQYGPSEASLYAFAQVDKDSEDKHYKIEAIVTTRTLVDVFTVKAHVKTVEEVAYDMYDGIYATSIDESNEDFMALSSADKKRVLDIIQANTFECDECGWTFENMYDSGSNLCDCCEEELEEEDLCEEVEDE